MRSRRPHLKLVASAVLAAGIACGTGSPVPAPTALSPGPLPDVQGLPRAETLVLLGFEPTRSEHIDPAAPGGTAAGYKGLLFGGLVRFTPDLKIAPELAADWSVSDDGLVYTFALDPEAAFSDGTTITAEDVIYSWTRALDDDNGYGDNAYLDDIEGAASLAAGETDVLSGVSAVDARTIEVRLRAPNTYFLGKLTFPTTHVVQRANVESGSDWYLSPVSSGPYRLREITPYDAVTLERHDGYPHAPAIRYVVYLTNEGGSSLSLFENGTLDWVGLWDDDAELIRDPAHRLHAQLNSVTSLCTWYLALNTREPGLADPNMREALALSIDRDLLFATLIDGDDRRATTILPPAMPGYEPRPEPDFEPEAARAALARSGIAPETLTVRLSVAGSSNDVGQLLGAVAQGWRETLGISVTAQVLDWYDYGDAVRRYTTDVTDAGWCADYPDAQNFLDPIAHSAGSYNNLGYRDAEVDAWLDAARAEPDPAARLTLYRRVEDRLLDTHVLIPLSHSAYATVVNPRVNGYVLTPFDVKLIPWLDLQP